MGSFSLVALWIVFFLLPFGSAAASYRRARSAVTSLNRAISLRFPGDRADGEWAHLGGPAGSQAGFRQTSANGFPQISTSPRSLVNLQHHNNCADAEQCSLITPTGQPKLVRSVRDGRKRNFTAREQLSRVVDWAMKNDQAVTLSSVVVSSSVTLIPSLNVMPSSTSLTSSWPLTRRQRSWAASRSL